MDENSLISIIKNEGVEFYDSEVVSENGNKIYRVFITCKDGVTLDQCATITNIISPLLDLNPPIKGKYFLEVSSPGIERKLKKPRHFQGSINEIVKVSLINTDTIIGTLVCANDTSITIDENGDKIDIAYDEIDKAKTYISWE